jgi:micrococcal nuclease
VPEGQTETARVLTIVDGDTIRVDRGNCSESVRYIGIDTPETRQPGARSSFRARRPPKRSERWSKDARLSSSVTLARRTGFGRLLRYV